MTYLAPDPLHPGGRAGGTKSAPERSGARGGRAASLPPGRDIAVAVLKPGGTFVGKIFQGAEFEDARDALRKHFSKVRIIRPKATRTESYEVFLVGLNRQN